MQHIQHADIIWQTDDLGHSVPISARFDDVYFSKSGGLSESNYVFLEGNGLSERFKNLSDHQSFTIIETGFGTGLNFLATCLLWSKTAPPSARLYFISTEKYPLSQSDLQHALSIWTDDEMVGLVRELIANYPLALTGCHRLHFGNVVLDLWLGDALASFEGLTARADAWFLDGFAPAKNDELWSSAVFDKIQELSKPTATLATFTSSGTVKRQLARIGMTVNKIKGFGRKREMLTAHFHAKDTPQTPPTTATVIGSGVSGLFVAYCLAERGVAVTLVDKLAPLAGASGNLRALFAPKLSLIDKVSEHLSTVSFLYGERVYRRLNDLSQSEILCQTGVVDFLLPSQKSYDKLSALVAEYPDELICLLNSDNADFCRQNISTFVPKAGLIDPKALAKFVLSHPKITFVQSHIIRIDRHHEQTCLTDDKGNVLTSKIAVICGGFESHLLDTALFNPRKIRGQVSYYPNANLSLATPIKYDGYCADVDGTLLMGASFVRNDTDTQVRACEHEFNVAKFRQSLPHTAHALPIDIHRLDGRASIRAQTPDYHPIVGQVRDGVYAVYGMGSKGFGFAPLCGELLACLVCDEPLPVPKPLLAKLSPHRPRLTTPIDQHQ